MKDEPIQKELRQFLARLPDAPVASNFTARVLQAVELEKSRAARGGRFNWNWRSLLPRLAVMAAAVLFAGVAIHHYELSSQRTRIAKSVALVAETQMPSVEALQNFDAIRRMSQPHADEGLLALGSVIK